VERGQLHRDPGASGRLLATDRLAPLAQVAIEPLPDRLGQQRHRGQVIDAVHGSPF